MFQSLEAPVSATRKPTAFKGQHAFLCLRNFIQVTAIHANVGACDLERLLDKLSWPATCKQVEAIQSTREGQT